MSSSLALHEHFVVEQQNFESHFTAVTNGTKLETKRLNSSSTLTGWFSATHSFSVLGRRQEQTTSENVASSPGSQSPEVNSKVRCVCVHTCTCVCLEFEGTFDINSKIGKLG